MAAFKNILLDFADEANLDLKCDFPARKSFRESLLVRLQLLNEQERISDADEPDRAIELSDDELSMLAAAGDFQIPQWDTQQ